MSKRIIYSIVIILGILIVFSFLALIYGIYTKISKSSHDLSKTSDIFSLELSKSEKIKNIEVMDKDKILILIDKNEGLRGIIYNTKKNEIIRFIDK